MVVINAKSATRIIALKKKVSYYKSSVDVSSNADEANEQRILDCYRMAFRRVIPFTGTHSTLAPKSPSYFCRVERVMGTL